MRTVTGFLVLAHAAVLLGVAFWLPEPGVFELLTASSMGVLHAQTALLAVWIVFSEKPLNVRVSASGLGIVLIGVTFCTYVIRTSGPPEVCVVSVVALLIQWIAIQIPLWLTKFSGWVIAQDESGLPTDPQSSQFHIRHLFIWTTAIAVLFGVGNALSGWFGEFGNDHGQWVGFFSIMTIANVLMAGPVIWATLTNHRRLAWGLVAIASLVLLTPIEASFFSALRTSQALLRNGVAFIVIQSLVYTVTIVTALLLARSYRWRLMRSTYR